ncbi:hypothetical protein CFP56_001616 [Quercus suber]|uniref:Uncharacterized protein n=1 Tax=Quercus suber TaxID=58331 RepID=A0AAW0LGK6_QUESU
MNQERVILFCGYSLDEPVVYSKDDDYGKTRMSWFTMLAPEIRAGPSSSGILSSASSSSLLRKRKTNTFTPPTLSPFAVTNLPKSTFFTAVGTSIFIFHDGVNKILTFKNSGDGDWKLAPPMKHPRKSPHIIVLDEDGNGNGDFDRRRSAYFKRRSASSSYLYSVVLEVSPTLDKPMDLAGFMGCNESLLKEFGMAQPSKAERDELLRQYAKRITNLGCPNSLSNLEKLKYVVFSIILTMDLKYTRLMKNP